MKAATLAVKLVVMLVEHLDGKRVELRVAQLVLRMVATLVVKREHYLADVTAGSTVEPKVYRRAVKLEPYLVAKTVALKATQKAA